VDTTNRVNPNRDLDAFHIQNFFNAIRNGDVLNADIDSGHKSTLLVQLGNIAQRIGSSLNIDPKTGHILNNTKAQGFWSREYEKGWEMKL
jgi:hypothetical protein